jgi:hypothetical protein
MTARIGALLLGLILLSAGPLSAQPEGESDPVAIIGSSVITEDEVARIAAGRPEAYADLPPDARRARIRDMLVAEYLVDYYYGRETGLLSQPVLDALDDARRQVLFQFFAQSQFTPPQITQAEIDAFAEDNPALFGDRRSFRYARLELSGGEADRRAEMQARAETILARPAPDLAALESLAAEARDAGLDVALDTGWTPSEALPPALRDRLAGMARNEARLDTRAAGGSVSVLRLYAAQALPTPPDVLRDRIEDRLVARAYQAHRATLIDQLAQQVLAPDDSAGETADGMAPETAGTGAARVTPPPRGTVVWSAAPVLPREVRLAALFVAALTGVGAGFAAVAWAGRVRAQHPLVVQQQMFVPTLRKRGTATILAGLILIALLAGAVLAGPAALRTLGDGTTLVLFAAGAAMAAAMAAAWRLRTRRTLDRAIAKAREVHSDEEMADDIARLGQGPGGVLAAALTLLILYAAALVLVLDIPPGLS